MWIKTKDGRYLNSDAIASLFITENRDSDIPWEVVADMLESTEVIESFESEKEAIKYLAKILGNIGVIND